MTGWLGSKQACMLRDSQVFLQANPGQSRSFAFYEHIAQLSVASRLWRFYRLRLSDPINVLVLMFHGFATKRPSSPLFTKAQFKANCCLSRGPRSNKRVKQAHTELLRQPCATHASQSSTCHRKNTFCLLPFCPFSSLQT